MLLKTCSTVTKKIVFEQGRVDVLTKVLDEVAGQITKANVAMKTCQRYV